MGSQGFLVMVNGDGFQISLDDHRFTDGPGRDGIKVAVETDRKVGMDLKRKGLPAVGSKLGQGLKVLGLETIYRSLTGGVMKSAIGLSIQPKPALAIDIGQISKGSEGPEVMPEVMDTPFFDFALFLRLIRVASPGSNPEGSQELQEGLIKANQRAFSL